MKLRRAGLNALFLKPGRVGGTERYTRELTAHLARLAPEITWTLFVSRDAAGWAAGLPASVRIVAAPVSADNRAARVMTEQSWLPAVSRQTGLDILLNLGGTGPLLSHCPQITMVHDLQYRFYPEYFSPAERLALDSLTHMSILRSAGVLVPSEKVKRDIVAVYDTRPEKITVTALGVDPSFRPARPEDLPERNSLWKSLDLKRPYLLSVGAARPNKGLDVLLDALAQLPESSGFETILIGAPGTGLAGVRRHPAVLSGRARWLGWIGDDLVPPLYRHATAAVISTRFEGFCMPAVEALASGTPLLATQISPVDELLDGSALLVAPDSPGLFSAGIDRILHEQQLRRTLSVTGPAVASRYTWERTATVTIAAMEQAIA